MQGLILVAGILILMAAGDLVAESHATMEWQWSRDVKNLARESARNAGRRREPIRRGRYAVAGAQGIGGQAQKKKR